MRVLTLCVEPEEPHTHTQKNLSYDVPIMRTHLSPWMCSSVLWLTDQDPGRKEDLTKRSKTGEF